MSTFLFLHGAFHGGWLSQKTIALLHAQGHDCHAPTLSGCGYLAHARPEVDLQNHIDDILNYIEDEELHDIILVTHGYSGMIGGAVMMLAEHRLRHVLFVDAAIPRHHHSFFDLADDTTRAMLSSPGSAAGYLAPCSCASLGIAGPLADWFSSRQREFPGMPLHSPFPMPFEPRNLPVTYFLCQSTMAPLYPRMAAQAIDMGWNVERLHSGHCPMVTEPRHFMIKILFNSASRYDVVKFLESS